MCNEWWVGFLVAREPLLENAWPTLHQWSQLGVSALLWVGLPLALGTWRGMRREVK